MQPLNTASLLHGGFFAHIYCFLFVCCVCLQCHFLIFWTFLHGFDVFQREFGTIQIGVSVAYCFGLFLSFFFLNILLICSEFLWLSWSNMFGIVGSRMLSALVWPLGATFLWYWESVLTQVPRSLEAPRIFVTSGASRQEKSTCSCLLTWNQANHTFI